MGIKKLKDIIKKYSPISIKQIHILDYETKKIAIDTSLYMFKSKAKNNSRGGRDTDWIIDFIYLVCCLRQNNIHPIFVYDTKSPQEKQVEKESRAAKKKSNIEKIKMIEQMISEYHKSGKINDYLYHMCDANQKTKTLLGNDKMFDIDVVMTKLEKLKSQIINVSTSDFTITRELFDILSIPYIDAIGEAEAMCSYLCHHGLVDAVLSEDTDILAYGCPKFLYGIDTIQNTVFEIDYKNLITNLDFSSSQFLDLCILCGTDYSSNIKGVGPEKSFQLIKHYQTIENIENIKDYNTGHNKYDTTLLNYPRVRELFKIPEELYTEISYTGIPDYERLHDFLNYYNINSHIFYQIKKAFDYQKISFCQEEKNEFYEKVEV